MARLSFREEDIGKSKVKFAKSRREPCIITILYINGVQGTIFDFGIIRDIGGSPPPNFFGCMDRAFLPYQYVPDKILEKYHMERSELDEFNAFFKKEMNFGKCDFCNRN